MGQTVPQWEPADVIDQVVYIDGTSVPANEIRVTNGVAGVKSCEIGIFL